MPRKNSYQGMFLTISQLTRLCLFRCPERELRLSSPSCLVQADNHLWLVTPAVTRLDGLAGLSVQDAELKLTPEQPCSLARPQTERDSSSERSMVDAANVIRHSEDTGVVVDPTNTSAVNESKKDKTKKNKRGTKGLGKKKHVLLQRGPLLITHKGENLMLVVPLLSKDASRWS